MVGQNNILEWVDNNINSFPHFIVLVGSSGCGKKTLSETIAYKLSCVYSKCSVSVDAVREVIETAYQSQTKVLYCFADADNMKPQAKNAMLKITEEPPENAYFCLTVCDDSSLLDTIKSRAYVINMQSYTKPELKKYYYSTLGAENPSEDEVNLFCEISTTPGDIDKLTEYGKEFYDYVELVVDNIAEVEPANAFKSSSKLALKKDEGYDLALFLKTFIYVCEKRIMLEINHYANGILETAKILNVCDKMGINKQQLYDKWVFRIREQWIEM